MRRRASILTTGLALAVLTVSSVLAGCYHRVVGAEGPGSSSYTIYEPNLDQPAKKDQKLTKWDNTGKK